MPTLVGKYFITFAGAVLLCVAATYLTRRLAQYFRVLDYPTAHRKIHSVAVPLMGGLGIFIAFAILTLTAFNFNWLSGARMSGQLIGGILAASFVLVLGGILDDAYNLSWRTQFLFPVTAALIVMAAGLTMPYVTNPFGGLLRLGTPVAEIVLFLWLLGMMYTTKLLDGVDGLTTSVSLVAALVIFVVSQFWDVRASATSFMALALAGAAAGFLVWNWYPAKIFLGEGGSTMLGFLLAVLAVMTGGKIATALLVMGAPILDVVRIIILRTLKRRKFYASDAEHLHFRLLRSGLTQRQVVLLLTGLSVAFGSVSFFSTTRGKIIGLVVLVVCMLVLVTFIDRRHEKNSSAS